MKLFTCTLAFAAFGLAVAAPAFADSVSELETDNAAINNTLATAQAIDYRAFTPNVNPNVFGSLPTATILGAGGDNDVDFFSFQANGGTVSFDIDNDPFTFDTFLSLFDSNGTLIALDDDSDSNPLDPGTEVYTDSFLGEFTLPSAGTYYIAVSQFLNSPTQYDFSNNNLGLVPLARPDGESGGFSVFGVTAGDSSFFSSGDQLGLPYTLHISLSSPVPEPGSMALLVGMMSAGGILLKRRRK